MISDRDKLIALIEQAEGQLNNDKPSVEQIADYLLEHGVGFFTDIRAENKRLLEALELLESELSDPSDDSEVGLLNNLNDRM